MREGAGMEPVTVGLGPSMIGFADERDRAPFQVPAGTVASVTITNADGSQQWGEFMTRADALAVLGWLTLLLSSETREPPVDPARAVT